MTRSIILAAVALASAAAFTAAHAEDAAIHIDLKGYDLSKPADAQKVYAQVQQAARTVCNASGHEVFGSDEAERVDICVRNTVASVVVQSKSPLLAALNGEIAPSVRMASTGEAR